MMKKKIVCVFIGIQSVDHYKSAGFFDEIGSCFELEVLKPEAIDINLNSITERQLPKIDFAWQVDFIKYIKEKASLRLNDKLFDNKNHHLYAPNRHATVLKQWIKFNLINLFSYFFASKKGVDFLEKRMGYYIKKSGFYKTSINILRSSKPDLVYLTHQNTSLTYGVSLAAKYLKIPTVCFIYSWDNVVKGNKLVKADYYFVWSNYMKAELLDYYKDEVNFEAIFVVGSPQFYHYFLDDFLIEKTIFFNAYKIPKSDYYICFSGNFNAIGQDDPAYLKDLALAVQEHNRLNQSQFHILLRANPVDYNFGFTAVVNAFSNVITDVNANWNTTKQPLPICENKLALSVLKTTIQYSDAVINVGSTMALDATLLNTLAYYIDYKIKNGSKKFKIENIYKFIHFKSLTEENEPIKHIKHPSQFKEIFEEVQKNTTKQLEKQQLWAKKIVEHPINKVSERMLEGFKKIVNL